MDASDQPGSSKQVELESTEAMLAHHIQQVRANVNLPDKEKKEICDLLVVQTRLQQKYDKLLEVELTGCGEKLFKLMDDVVEKLKKVKGRLSFLGVVYEGTDEAEDTSLEPVFITSCNFEPLNERLTEFVNDPANSDDKGLVLTTRKFMKIVRALKEEHGEEMLLNAGIPLNNRVELSSYIVQQIQNVTRYVRCKRTWEKLIGEFGDEEDGLKPVETDSQFNQDDSRLRKVLCKIATESSANEYNDEDDDGDSQPNDLEEVDEEQDVNIDHLFESDSSHGSDCESKNEEGRTSFPAIDIAEHCIGTTLKRPTSHDVEVEQSPFSEPNNKKLRVVEQQMQLPSSSTLISNDNVESYVDFPYISRKPAESSYVEVVTISDSDESDSDVIPL